MNGHRSRSSVVVSPVPPGSPVTPERQARERERRGRLSTQRRRTCSAILVQSQDYDWGVLYSGMIHVRDNAFVLESKTYSDKRLPSSCLLFLLTPLLLF